MPSLHVMFDVWGDRKGYVFVPRNKGWVQQPNGSYKTKTFGQDDPAFSWPSDESKKAITARVEGAIAAGEDVYWCPTVFEDPFRKKAFVPDTADFLWADLDEVDPRGLALRPSVAWESSEGHYQALWRLDGRYSSDEVEQLNHALTAATGADPGGWASNKVLRVPATPNHKPTYDASRENALLWADSRTYSREDILAQVAVTPQAKLGAAYELPKYTRELLNAVPQVGDDRSGKLWELAKLLHEANVPELDMLELLKKSAWNKYAGRSDEATRLRETIAKSRVAIAPVAVAEDWLEPMEDIFNSELPSPEWLVDGIWQKGGYGLTAGEPKTYKTMLALAFALSVASGRPFLNRFRVNFCGPVLYVQEENHPSTMKDRLFRMAIAMGMSAIEFDKVKELVFISNNRGLDLTTPDGKAQLEKMITDKRPTLVVLDPLFMMMGDVDENASNEVKPVLTFLSSLRNKYGVTLMVIHHFKKSDSSRPGQRVRGSSAFHGWVENGLYTRVDNSRPGFIVLEREFRAFGLRDKMGFKFEMTENSLEYAVEVETERTASIASSRLTSTTAAATLVDTVSEQVLDALKSSPMPLSKTEIQTATGLSDYQLKIAMADLEKLGRVDKSVVKGRTAKFVLSPKETGRSDGVQVQDETN